STAAASRRTTAAGSSRRTARTRKEAATRGMSPSPPATARGDPLYSSPRPRPARPGSRAVHFLEIGVAVEDFLVELQEAAGFEMVEATRTHGLVNGHLQAVHELLLRELHVAEHFAD